MKPETPLDLILTINSNFQSNKLRKRLINEGYLEPVCSSCSLTEWQGVPIPLELDHINGTNTDNRLMNLRLLCPNCHALTSNYRGKNWGKATKKHHYAGVAERQTQRP